MTQPNPIVVAGIDVGKAGLDAHILAGDLQRHFNNDRSGRRALLRNWLLKHGVTRAVFEPTGAIIAACTSASSRPACKPCWSIPCARGALPRPSVKTPRTTAWTLPCSPASAS